MVRKKDGSMQMCVNNCALNAQTIRDSYPVTCIQESLVTLSGARFFSICDLRSGYWQIGLTADAHEKAASCSRSSLYKWDVMLFGLANVPATFQGLMDCVLSGLQ